MTATYVDPLAAAHVTPERIDQGVDYAGTGSLVAIARGIITRIVPASQSGWPGNFIEYKITQKGPLQGKYVYYAEGVTPAAGLKVGQAVNPGQAVANLIPGWGSGIEIGYGSGIGTSAYASSHGGFDGKDPTPAGVAFSDLIKSLGGPAGVKEGPVSAGSAPAGGAGGGIASGSILNPLGNLAGDLIGGLAGGSPSDVKGATTLAKGGTSALSAGEAFANFLSNPVPALLTIALVLGGALMVYEGAGRMLGFGAPVKSTAKTAAVVIAK